MLNNELNILELYRLSYDWQNNILTDFCHNVFNLDYGIKDLDAALKLAFYYNDAYLINLLTIIKDKNNP